MKTSKIFIEQDVFRGQLFEPEQKQDKVIIVFMGGEGKHNFCRLISREDSKL